jgi:hypothetical protein
MNNIETANHIRTKISKPMSAFAWVTDGCGYDQHIEFVKHRNDNWHGEPEEWTRFVLDYADELEKQTPTLGG